MMASRSNHVGYMTCGSNRTHCCGGNSNYCNNNNVKNNKNNNNNMLPIYFDEAILHRIAFTVWHTALHLEREQHSYDAMPTKNPAKTKQPATLTSQPRVTSGGVAGKSPRSRGEGMDLSYVTERIIALWVPGDVSPVAYRQGQQKAAHMLQTKHGNNYMVFNLSEPQRVTRSHHERVRELGWPADLAPPLERLCSVCKDIESWLSEDSHRIAVIHARGSKDRIGVVIAAYMHYSSICGSADQALDRFAMSRYLEDKVGDLEQPSHKRYVEYFSGLLSGSIRINSAPLYLTHVTVLGAPAFEPAEGRVGGSLDAAGGCRAFLKVYEGLIPVYTSGVYSVCGGTRQFTVNVAGERQRRGLQLRGDILLKCYHRHYSPVPTGSPSAPSPSASAAERPQRELIFACQFHTCAVTDYTLSFTRQELDSACSDLRFPLDGAVELHFSATPEIRLPSPAPTPAVPVDTTDDLVTRWDSYENIAAMGSPLDGDTDIEDLNGGEDEAELNHTFGPLDGSLYATIAKKQQQELQHQEEQRQQQLRSSREETPVRGPQQELAGGGAAVIGSPHTVSMDSGISSAGNGLLLHKHHLHHSNSNNTSNASSTSPPPPLTSLNGHGGSLLQPSPSTSTVTPLSPQDHHRALDELLNDMLLTVENIPDLPPSTTSPYGNRSFTATTTRHVATLDDLHPPRPFQHHYSSPSVATCDVINLPSTTRSASSCGNIQPAKQLNNGYGTNDTSAPGGGGDRTNVTNTSMVLDDLVDVNYIDDTETDDNIPYHARQDSRPFTYGAIPTSPQQQQITTPSSGQVPTSTMLQMHSGLASPSLVRKASFRSGAGTPKGSPVSSTTTLRQSPLIISSAQPSPPEDFVDGDLSPTRDYRYNNGAGSTSPRSPEFHDGHIVSITSNTSSHNLTWLQRQQQKLRERKEVQMRTERYPQESRLITELRTIQQHSYSRVLRPSASHRADGYTSDTTHFADDDDDQEDFTIPLHINTTTTSPTHKLNSVGSAPASPLLPNRTSSRRYYGTSTTPSHQSSSTSYLSGGIGITPLGRQKSDSSFDRERPFVAVKRAHEQSRKFKETQSPPTSPQAVLAAHPLGLALPHHGELSNKDPQADSAGLLTMVEEQQLLLQQQQQQQTATLRRGAGGGVGRNATNTPGSISGTNNNNHHQPDALASLMASLAASSAPASASSNTNSTAWQPQLREDSFSSWRTTSISDETGSPPRSSSPRPQTPAFPVHPRTPYVNSSSQQFDPPTSSTGLPPKSPTTQRKDRSPSPVSDLPPANTVPHQNISITSTSSGGSSNGRGVIGVNTVTGFPTTSHSSVSLSDGSYPQQSPKSSALQNGSTGQSSPTVYYGHSRRSSLHSNSEPPQEVSPAHVKFVRDTSRFWYKAIISREEAINMLRDQAPGTFVVRDSNSFPGAFGLALKVATPPPNLQNKTNDPSSELVRHFLIEPTSRGVKLKGCSNEPVFSSLSALVYQHSLMPMALPCRLLLPEGDGSRLPADSPGTVSTAQLLLAQGAACNVLYLYTLDTESLTGPQAIKKAVQHMFSTRPLPTATVVHFKVSGQGITLTDNKRQLFFRKHYPVMTISYCGLDPDDHRWSQKNDETGMPISSNRCFGFVARKPASKTDNQCHIFAELEPEQPASAIVNFVSKVMMSGASAKANIV